MGKKTAAKKKAQKPGVKIPLTPNSASVTNSALPSPDKLTSVKDVAPVFHTPPTSPSTPVNEIPSIDALVQQDLAKESRPDLSGPQQLTPLEEEQEAHADFVKDESEEEPQGLQESEIQAPLEPAPEPEQEQVEPPTQGSEVPEGQAESQQEDSTQTHQHVDGDVTQEPEQPPHTSEPNEPTQEAEDAHVSPEPESNAPEEQDHLVAAESESEVQQETGEVVQLSTPHEDEQATSQEPAAEPEAQQAEEPPLPPDWELHDEEHPAAQESEPEQQQQQQQQQDPPQPLDSEPQEEDQLAPQEPEPEPAEEELSLPIDSDPPPQDDLQQASQASEAEAQNPQEEEPPLPVDSDPAPKDEEQQQSEQAPEHQSEEELSLPADPQDEDQEPSHQSDTEAKDQDQQEDLQAPPEDEPTLETQQEEEPLVDLDPPEMQDEVQQTSQVPEEVLEEHVPPDSDQQASQEPDQSLEALQDDQQTSQEMSQELENHQEEDALPPIDSNTQDAGEGREASQEYEEALETQQEAQQTQEPGQELGSEEPLAPLETEVQSPEAPESQQAEESQEQQETEPQEPSQQESEPTVNPEADQTPSSGSKATNGAPPENTATVSEITAKDIATKDITAIADLFATMKTSLGSMTSAFDRLGGQSEKMVSLSLDIKAAEQLRQVKIKLEEQITRQKTDVETLRLALQTKIKEAVEEKLRAQLRDVIRNSLKKQIEEQVRAQLAVQIPEDLRQQVISTQRKIIEVKTSLHNSEARRYNALQTIPGAVLRPLLRPLPTPEQSPVPIIISRSSSLGTIGMTTPASAFPQGPAPTPIRRSLSSSLRAGGAETIPPSPSRFFPRDLTALFALSQEEARRLLREYGLSSATPSPAVEHPPRPRGLSIVNEEGTDAVVEEDPEVHAQDMNTFMAHIGVPFLMIPPPKEKYSETAPLSSKSRRKMLTPLIIK